VPFKRDVARRIDRVIDYFGASAKRGRPRNPRAPYHIVTAEVDDRRGARFSTLAAALTVLVVLVLALAGLERAAFRVAPLTTPHRGSEVSVSLVW
jgi:hypothetical protein